MHRTLLAAFLSAVLALPTSDRAVAAPKAHPATLQAFAEENPDETLPVFVMTRRPLEASSAGYLEEVLQEAMRHGEAFRLPLIAGMAGRLPGSTIVRLLQDPRTEVVWYYRDHAHNLAIYVNAVRALSYVVAGEALVANLSSRSLEFGFDPDEPVNRATRAAAEHGRVVVVAAGNDGPVPGTLNPWCAPWVVCVGATTKGGAALADFSGRAAKGEAVHLPTVVAPGVDILTTHPPHVPKAPHLLEAEQRIGLDKLVPPEKRAMYTVVKGTSFAAPQVSRIAALAIHLARSEMEEGERTGAKTFEVAYARPLGRDPDPRTTVRREVGTIREDNGRRVATYPLEPSAALVKQMLMDLAVGVGIHGSEEIGAGYIDWDLAADSFGRRGVPNTLISPLRAMDQ